MADSSDTEDKGLIRGSVERIIAMTIWIITKNPLIEHFMTLEVTPGPNPANEIMIRAPKWQGTRPVQEAERFQQLSDSLDLIKSSCYPGKFFTEGHAAQVTPGEDDKGPYIKVTSIGKGNRGTDLLRLVMARQFREDAQRRSLEYQFHHH